MVLVGTNDGPVIGALDGSKVGRIEVGVLVMAVDSFDGPPVPRTFETAKAYTVQ